MANVLNRKAVKKYILERCKVARPGWPCERIGKQALDDMEAFVLNKINQSIHKHPTVGKTYKHFY